MGFASESRERVRPVLPLAGMVDVLFLLLIFFLSTYSMREQDMLVDIDPPTSQSGEAAGVSSDRIIISVDRDGPVTVNSRQVEIDDLTQFLDDYAELVRLGKQTPVMLYIDEFVYHGRTVRVMDAVGQAGYENMAFAVAEGEE